VIGRFPIARTLSGYENQILIGHIRERNVVRKKAAVCGEERCVTSLKTAAKETRQSEPGRLSLAFKTLASVYVEIGEVKISRHAKKNNVSLLISPSLVFTNHHPYYQLQRAMEDLK